VSEICQVRVIRRRNFKSGSDEQQHDAPSKVTAVAQRVVYPLDILKMIKTGCCAANPSSWPMAPRTSLRFADQLLQSVIVAGRQANAGRTCQVRMRRDCASNASSWTDFRQATGRARTRQHVRFMNETKR
jgi:hypothetical protein